MKGCSKQDHVLEHILKSQNRKQQSNTSPTNPGFIVFRNSNPILLLMRHLCVAHEEVNTQLGGSHFSFRTYEIYFDIKTFFDDKEYRYYNKDSHRVRTYCNVYK